jgi:hypothetical protein
MKVTNAGKSTRITVDTVVEKDTCVGDDCPFRPKRKGTKRKRQGTKRKRQLKKWYWTWQKKLKKNEQLLPSGNPFKPLIFFSQSSSNKTSFPIQAQVMKK